MPQKIKWIKFFSRGNHPLLFIDSVTIAYRDKYAKYFNLPF